MRLSTYRVALAQALAVALATTSGVVLCVALRGSTRRRPLPFYSDATHAEPERTVLALAENFALALLPLVGLFERAQHERLLGTPLPLVAVLNGAAYAATVVCYWVTANTPTLPPWTPLHQMAASLLMACYAVQATCKALIARKIGSRSVPLRWRLGVASVLWATLLAVFVCFLLIKADRAKHAALSLMAASVHLATIGCVMLMLILARDLRSETVSIVAIEPQYGRHDDYKLLPCVSFFLTTPSHPSHLAPPHPPIRPPSPATSHITSQKQQGHSQMRLSTPPKQLSIPRIRDVLSSMPQP